MIPNFRADTPVMMLPVRIETLYFDGNISRLYAPSLGRHDGGFPMGPMVGTVVPKG